MSIFAIGDLHLSFNTDKPMDIFGGWSDYVYRLEKQWNSVVTDNDTVVINGDISWCMKLEDCYKDFEFINNLKGRKIIIKGNHDYWWTTMRKMDNFLLQNKFDTMHFLLNDAYESGDFVICGSRGWYFDATSETDKKTVLREAQRLKTSIEKGLETGKEPLVFLHYPPVLDERKCDEIYNVLTEYNIRRCWFGHLHGEKTGRYRLFESDGIEFSLISSDFLSFCPKLIEKFHNF